MINRILDSLNPNQILSYFNNAPIGLALLKGPQHTFAYANDFYLNTFFYGKKIIGFSLAEVMPEVVEQGFKAILDKVYTTGEPYEGKEISVNLERGDGKLVHFYINFTYQPVFDSETNRPSGILVIANDITSTVMSRNQVENEKNWYENILNHFPQALYFIDTNSKKISFMNNAAIEMSGSSIIGTQLPDRYPQTTRMYNTQGRLLAVEETPSARTLSGNELLNEEMILENDLGQFRVVVSSQNISATYNHPPTSVLLLQDITSIRSEEEKYRKFTEQAPQMPFIANANGDIIYFSPQWYKYIGQLPGTEGWGWKNQPLHHPEDLQRTIERWSHSIKTGEPYSIEYRLRRHDGEYRWHLGTALPQKDASGKITSWYGANIDIHEQKMLAEKLQSAIDAANLGFWEYDINQDSLEWSEQFRKHFSFPAGKLGGKSEDLFTKILPEDSPILKKSLTATIEKNQTYKSQYRVLTPDKQIKWLKCEGILLTDAEGKPQKIRGTTQDITESKNYEINIKAAKDAAEAASSTKSAFLANMSHEIRTPLSAILGFTRLLKSQQLDEKSREFLSIIERSGQSLTKIIEDILDLSKVESGKLVIEKTEFNLNTMLNDCLTLFEYKAKSKGIQLYLKNEFPSNLHVFSDPSRILQILVNLIGNAVKFTEKGFVEVTVTSNELNKNEHLFKIKIKDTGSGLNESQKSKLFQPFVQADDSVARKFGGTGLGLALSKKLAQAIEGDVYFDEAQHHPGTVVVFEFQTEIQSIVDSQNSSNNSTTNLASKDKTLEKIEILVVDDSPDNRMLMQYLLSEQGALVTEACGGEEALNILKNKSFDIVLMDIQMPGTDGFSALKKSRELGFKTPIIALTAHAMIEEKNKALDAGFCDHVAKPVDMVELTKSILTHLETRKQCRF